MINPIEEKEVEKLKRACPTYRDFGLGEKINELIVKINDLEKMTKPYSSLKYCKDYLYEITYDFLDYEYANNYFKTLKISNPPALCSGVRKNNLFLRTFDWIYDNNTEFWVHVTKNGNRFESWGTAAGISGITDDFINSGKYNDDYKVVPFRMCDGYNEKGVFATMNVVPNDLGNNPKTIPEIEERESVCSMALIRYILDNFETAEEAVNYIKNYVSIYAITTLSAMNYEIHYMIMDDTNTFLIEIIDNAVEITDISESPYMTNFYRHNVIYNEDGTVYTPETQEGELNAIDYNHITPHGAGLERYNLIVNNYSDLNTLNSMKSMRELLKYTNAYKEETDPFWYSELVGINNLTVNSNVEDFAETKSKAIEIFENRSRDTENDYYGTWQTTHGIIYDIEEKKAYMVVQEDTENEIIFNLE